MNGLDGAVLDEFTQGINAPANGQQGYFTVADAQTPRPNLEYITNQAAAIKLKLPIAQYAESKTVEPATIAASGGTHSIALTVPTLVNTVFEYVLRSQVRIGTTMTWFARTRLMVWTGPAGTITGSNAAAELTAGSGFTLSPSATGSTITHLVTSSSGSVGDIFSSITEVYRKQFGA